MQFILKTTLLSIALLTGSGAAFAFCPATSGSMGFRAACGKPNPSESQNRPARRVRPGYFWNLSPLEMEMIAPRAERNR